MTCAGMATMALAAAAQLWAADAAREPAPRLNSDSMQGSNPGCVTIDAKACVEQALAAMGGSDRLAALKSVRLETVGHTALVEQSYRQAPFITSYDRDKIVVDLADGRVLTNQHAVWPESDPKQAEFDATAVSGIDGCVSKSGGKDFPCAAGEVDATRARIALGPERLLMTADAAPDLHYEAAETIRSSAHSVVAFKWNGVPVRVLLNQWNHLPDAVETTQQFKDFWYFWGDVRQVVYWDGWQLIHGIKYPTTRVIERNGIEWSSSQVIDIEFNAPVDGHAFAMDPAVAKLSTQNAGWSRPFRGDQHSELASGIDLFEGSWNATIVKQTDGVVLLETPISGTFTDGLFAEVKKRYPDAPIKAVLTTSDSWPHVGGVRYDVAQGKPIYILDMNRPLLDRMISAAHTIDPDALEKAKKMPNWKIVSGKTEIGTGDNRMVIYPLRGSSTERQYMVYFPDRRLLYASDTLAINPDKTLYDPELMREVEQAVERENLTVDTVFAMHEGPLKWSDVVEMIGKANS